VTTVQAGLNRVTRHIAPWMPGLGVVIHRGRRSGRRYETPVNSSRDTRPVPSLTARKIMDVP